MFQGLELGCRSLLVQGGGQLPQGAAVVVELQLRGGAVQLLTRVDASEMILGHPVARLRIEASTPDGHDLIADEILRSRWAA